MITKDGAEQFLFSDIKIFEEGVTAILDAREISVNQNQFDALVCFSLNVGLTSLQDITLLKKLEAGDTQGAANEFLRWHKAGGKELAGLTRLRQAER